MELQNPFNQKEKFHKDGKSPLSSYFLPVFGTLAVVTLFITLIYYADKGVEKRDARRAKKAVYVRAIILKKTLDTRTNDRKLVYRNERNRIFIINDDNLWNNAEAGDSVEIGYIETGDTSNIFHSVKFKSVKVIAKAKTPMEVTIFSSAEPDHIVGAPVIIH